MVKKDKTTQEAHLRVVLHHEGKYQLLFFADFENFDLYAGPHGTRNLLRSSWHATGQVHTHTPAGREDGTPQVPPEDFKGRERLYSGGYTGNDWSYKPKPDSPIRRTLVIDQHAVERNIMLDLWAVEKGRADLVAEILAEYDGSKGIELVSYLPIDWSQPQLVVVVGTMTLASWTALQEVINRPRK